jgi:hypothetical protein
MSVRSQVQAAEEALRQALINALAEGDEDCLSELFTQYQAVSNLNKKVNDLTHFAYDSNYNFNLSSDYLNRPGGDMDALDNVIDFGNNISITTGNIDDTITFS